MEPGSGELIQRLTAICGREHVLTEDGELATYRSDGLLHYRQSPLVAVLPGDGHEVAAVVHACHEARVPFVARGSGTGLSGGALPLAEGVLIVLARMRRILEIDLDNRRVVVQPGVTNLGVSRAVAPTHFYPPDPSSQIVCSIGGNVAENSGGAHCFKYGFTTNYVTGLKVVLCDGTVADLHRDQPGMTCSARSSARRERSGSPPRSRCGSCPPLSRCARCSPSFPIPAPRAKR